MKQIDSTFDFITGAMVGFEVIQEDDLTGLIVDLLFFRIMIAWD
jgi:hypothetical protein